MGLVSVNHPVDPASQADICLSCSMPTRSVRPPRLNWLSASDRQIWALSRKTLSRKKAQRSCTSPMKSGFWSKVLLICKPLHSSGIRLADIRSFGLNHYGSYYVNGKALDPTTVSGPALGFGPSEKVMEKDGIIIGNPGKNAQPHDGANIQHLRLPGFADDHQCRGVSEKSYSTSINATRHLQRCQSISPSRVLPLMAKTNFLWNNRSRTSNDNTITQAISKRCSRPSGTTA